MFIKYNETLSAILLVGDCIGVQKEAPQLSDLIARTCNAPAGSANELTALLKARRS